jgi:putative transposase
MDKEDISQHQKKARMRKAVLLFEDEAFFQQEGTTRQSWARRGKGFTVYHHPCKRKSKFFGAVSISKRPQLVFKKEEWFNTRTFQKFLEFLLRRFRKVCLILDNVRYHHAKGLRPFLRKNRGRLWLYYLPPYSPDLSAIEPVWRETRRDSTHNRYFASKRGLTRVVQTQFRIYQAEPWQLSGIVAPFL